MSRHVICHDYHGIPSSVGLQNDPYYGESYEDYSIIQLQQCFE